MAGHYAGHSLMAGFFEREKFHFFQMARRRRDLREGLMAVRFRIPVPREMFYAGQHSRTLQPADESHHLVRHPVRIAAERANPDNGILRIGIHIGCRGEIKVYAHPDASQPDPATDLAYQAVVLHGAQGHRPRVVERRIQPHSQAPFEVHRRKERYFRCIDETGHVFGGVLVNGYSADMAVLHQVERPLQLRVVFQENRRDEHLPYFFLQTHRLYEGIDLFPGLITQGSIIEPFSRLGKQGGA